MTGTTNFSALSATLSGGNEVPIGLVIGLVFLISGLAFKVSAVPFHMWTPDVYEGAPTPITAFFAVAPKVAAIALFLRVMMSPFGELVSEWQQVIIVISIASMVLGAFAAIWQDNIKRLMAYSSIGHMGFALVGLAAGTEEGMRGTIIYMTIYLVMNIGTFAVILNMKRAGNMVVGIHDLAGLGRSRPMMALAMGIFMFSLAGVPPLAGFFGKFYVFLAAVNAELYTLAVIGVLASVVGAFYYLRIIKIMYFDASSEELDSAMAPEMRLILAVSAVITLFFFVYPSPFLAGAQAAAQALIQ
jgi:NADH-quinone oxidoreductase subunit N